MNWLDGGDSKPFQCAVAPSDIKRQGRGTVPLRQRQGCGMNGNFGGIQRARLGLPLGPTKGAKRVRRRWSVRAKLMAMAVAASALIFVVLLVALYAFSTAADADALALRVTAIADVSTGLDAGRHAASAAASEALVSGLTPEINDEFHGMIEETREREARINPVGLPPGVLQALTAQEVGVQAFFDSASTVLTLSETDRRTAMHELHELQELNTKLEESQIRLDATLNQAADDASRKAQQIRDRARTLMLAVALSAILLMFTFGYAVGRFIVRSLSQLAAAAAAIAAGELDARSGITSGDEIGAVGQALDAMADNLQELLFEMGEETRRDLFKSQLVEAFELTDDEQDAHHQVALTMAHISEKLPMELLLSDSSRAHLRAAVVHPVAGGPGCGVQTPYACLAVRRSRVVITDSSSNLNSCPKLRDRDSGACSAVCLPVTFMGKALGVVHVTGPEGAPPNPEQVARLTALAGQAGSAIGTIRATQVTQLQAMTDGLTGLINRRTLENNLRDLLESGAPFSIAMADVDHFKVVNDTFGHDAGDRALRLLTETFRSSIRSQDFVGRYGGEEFVLVFPDLSIPETKDVLERLRVRLAEAQQSAAVPTFTVSYGVTNSRSGSTLDEILRYADRALSTAKRDGRDRIVAADNRDNHHLRSFGAELPSPRPAPMEPTAPSLGRAGRLPSGDILGKAGDPEP
jgi:diguanylate cyclase (GGDEF)-like protein